jgi:diacylglycerol O-acyltransferase
VDALPPAPRTILNGIGRSRYRVYRYETFSLSEFKALTRIFGCTINTLVLAVCSEALKRYLQEVDTLPSTSLLAAMPMGDLGRRRGPTRLHRTPPHNSVAVAIVPLHQDIDDFEQRVRAIQKSARAAIEQVRHTEGRRFDNLLEFLPGTFIRWLFAVLERRQEKGASPYANVVISNVPGPRKPLRALDGRLEMVELLSTGNIADPGNLNITVWSYVDNLSFSFYMRKGALPTPERLTSHLREVVEALQKQYPAEERPLPAD